MSYLAHSARLVGLTGESSILRHWLRELWGDTSCPLYMYFHNVATKPPFDDYDNMLNWLHVDVVKDLSLSLNDTSIVYMQALLVLSVLSFAN